jgi:hypothetical protein
MKSETFSLAAHVLPDYSLAENWSGGMIPGIGMTAVIDNANVLVDPELTISARIILQGAASLSGNGGGFSLAASSTVTVEGTDSLFADGAIVNHGVLRVAGPDVSLRVVVEAGQAIAESYGLTVPSFKNAGLITLANAGTLAIDGTEFSNTGEILVSGGTLAVLGGGVDGGQTEPMPGGRIVLEAGGDVAFSEGVTRQTIDFVGTGTLSFADPADVSNVTINDFQDGGTILLPSVSDAEALLARLKFSGLPAGVAPGVIATATGAAIVLEPAAPCFARGTFLLTPTGYAPVETLRPGDRLVTRSGDVRLVRWVGWRAVDVAAHRRPESVHPIRILPHSFATGVPARTLRLSPDHALFLQGVLVPAKLLVNGATILRERRCQAVTYYHVELDRHDILIAENLPAESYLDTGNRHMFENAAGAPRKNPVFGRGRQWDRNAYAELCLGGAILRRARREIADRAWALGYRKKTLTDVSLWVAGRKYLPIAGTAERPVFRISSMGHTMASIRSGRFVPAEMDDGEGQDDDGRVLGIAINRIRLGLVPVAPRDVAISGFYPRAPGDSADWTDGNGVIALPSNVGGLSLGIAALPQAWQPPPGSVKLDI